MEVNLVFVRKDGTTQTFPLPSAVTFVGRRQDCDMCIPLSVVSRRHCEIYTEHSKAHVRDLKSRNGTFVNEKSVEETQLKAGDVLRVGPVKFIIQIDGAPNTFDEYLPAPIEEVMQPQAATPAEDETVEAELEDISESLEKVSGQSQTMDIDNIFSDNLLGDDDLDLGSDIA